MSDRDDDLEYPGPGGPGSGHGGGGTDRDPPGAAPSGYLRGVGVVIVAVIIGVLLMPSATRAPLEVKTAAASTPSSSTPPTTAPRTGSTTTSLATIVPGASSVHVLVANGTSITALAAGTSTYLRSRGFLTLAPTNSTTKVTRTQVYAVSGPSSSATSVIEALGLSAATVQPTGAVAPVPSTTGANVVVITGPDLARLAPGSTTSSTSAPTD
ncbi:MAG: LytR C-terminal domain-containing protein [Acidimicrobiales bacterium]